MVDPRKVNFEARETMPERTNPVDRFFLYATPIWFDWLTWILIIGAIQVVADKTNDIYVHAILGISYFFFFSYMFAYFYKNKINGIPFIESNKIRRIVSIILSAWISLCVFYLLSHLVNPL